jgi:hypothetical protein
VGTSYWPNGYNFRLDGSTLSLTGDPTTVSALSQSLGPTYWGTMYSTTLALTPGTHSVDVIAERTWAAVDYVEVAPMVEP